MRNPLCNEPNDKRKRFQGDQFQKSWTLLLASTTSYAIKTLLNKQNMQIRIVVQPYYQAKNKTVVLIQLQISLQHHHLSQLHLKQQAQFLSYEKPWKTINWSRILSKNWEIAYSIALPHLKPITK